jgi:hypothetical protein
LMVTFRNKPMMNLILAEIRVSMPILKNYSEDLYEITMYGIINVALI